MADDLGSRGRPGRVRYLALGPVTVSSPDGEVALGGKNQRTLLAVLLAHGGGEVTASALAEALWPTRPPASELHAVQTVVSRLRRALGEHRSDVVTTADGYRLVSSDTDVSQFEELLTEAAGAQPPQAVGILDGALALWRGHAYGLLAELDAVRTEAIRLDQLRLNAMEDRFQLLLDLGRYGVAIPELEAFVAVQPLRERARAMLMQALYWSNRQADALAAYASYRNLLGEDLGLEPSAGLRKLEESIVLDALPHPAPAPGGEARLFGRRGRQLVDGPDAQALESQGWDLLWDHDHEGAVEARQKAYVQLLKTGDRPGAARLAIWLGVSAAIRLRNAVAFGWLQRAKQLLEGEPPGAAHGLLSGLVGMVEVLGGQLDDALEHARAAQEIGVSCGDLEVEALGKAIRGWATIRLGDRRRGMALMDEAMASATSGELGRYVSALIYCRTLCACLDLMDYERASEWTEEIIRARDAGGVADLPGDCRTHRVEIMVVRGEWDEGDRQAAMACAETERFDLTHLAMAKALRGEILLRRGDLDGAESELGAAQEMGASPQPALALLHLARGEVELAASSIRDAVAEAAHDPLRQARLLPAAVEIALADRDTATAATAASTLDAAAERFGTSALQASAKHALGSVQLARGEVSAAVRTLRSAHQRWMAVGSSHRAAISRLLLARALAAAGRETDAAVEASAARQALSQLGAVTDLALEGLGSPAAHR